MDPHLKKTYLIVPYIRNDGISGVTARARLVAAALVLSAAHDIEISVTLKLCTLMSVGTAHHVFKSLRVQEQTSGSASLLRRLVGVFSCYFF